MEIAYSGAPSGVGAISTWKHGREGGKNEIVESDPKVGVTFRITMENGFWMIGRIRFAREGAATRVSWSASGEVGNPFVRFLPLLMKGMIGGKYEKGLAAIKALVEKTPVSV